MNKGFNHFDIVYFINLDHRTDRLEHITTELNKTNIEPIKINKISAVYTPNLGALGCSKSHVIALESFLKTPETNQTCVILEDDFVFTQEQCVVNDLINKVFDNNVDFDVLMLSANIAYQTPTKYSFLNKIYNAQTTSGYVVCRRFASILLDNYKQSVELLEEHNIGYNNCIDMHMKQLQPYYNWYCLNPKIGIQMASFSDVEKRFVKYGC